MSQTLKTWLTHAAWVFSIALTMLALLIWLLRDLGLTGKDWAIAAVVCLVSGIIARGTYALYGVLQELLGKWLALIALAALIAASSMVLALLLPKCPATSGGVRCTVPEAASLALTVTGAYTLIVLLGVVTGISVAIWSQVIGVLKSMLPYKKEKAVIAEDSADNENSVKLEKN